MRGLFMFLVMMTVVALGLAGCPKDDAATTGAKPMQTLDGAGGGDAGEADADAGDTGE